jgi:thiol:disulfide interchange protein DsbC
MGSQEKYEMRKLLAKPCLGALGRAAVLGLAYIAVANAGEKEIRNALLERMPTATVDFVTESAVAGIYEVSVSGQLVYATEDGRYVFTGSLIELASGRNLGDQSRNKLRVNAIAKMPESKMIIYEPTDELKTTATIFTDIDCPFCRKLHGEIGLLNDLGVRVRYMLYPRTGAQSESYIKAVSVWCAEDRLSALTKAKLGETPPELSCDNPVEEHMILAEQLGIRGTPMIVSQTGGVISGYVPANELVVRLKESSN